MNLESSYGGTLGSNKKSDKVLKMDAKLKKEACLKYSSFMLGQVQVNELDRSILDQKGRFYLNGKIRADNSSNYLGMGLYNQDSNQYLSRDGTPNPFD